jgi:hypothetical protein
MGEVDGDYHESFAISTLSCGIALTDHQPEEAECPESVYVENT